MIYKNLNSCPDSWLYVHIESVLERKVKRRREEKVKVLEKMISGGKGVRYQDKHIKRGRKWESDAVFLTG